MPTPARTDRAAIVEAGRLIVESSGLEGLTMQAVAERVGVRAPSLYKHVRDRRELIALVVGATLDDLAGRLVATTSEPDPRARLVLQATELRRFAHQHPAGFSLVFALHDAPRPEPETAARAVSPVLDAVAELVGAEHALDGARLVTAWANGFLSMELGGAFRLGPGVDEAWEWGLHRIIAALSDRG
ncbi:MAG TPA: WHG domain-containing protein [Pseudolysinimonas sp.]|jgi:AcrR family transcriptional regulator|nr:WHG domain-containing protein [Pseudolysinimonas sp.]